MDESPPSSRNALSRFAAAVVGALQCGWAWVRAIGAVLKPCRFSVLTLLLATVVFWIVEQGREGLRIVVQDLEFRPFWVGGTFIAALLFWAFSSWYWARVISYFDVIDSPVGKEHLKSLLKIVPRVLGVLPFVIVIVGMLIIHTAEDTGTFWVFWALTCGLAVAFYGFLVVRRKLFKIKPMAGLALLGIIELEARTRWALALLAIVSLGFFVAAWFWPQAAGWVGPAPLLMFGFGTWAAIGNIVVYWGASYRLPVLSMLLFWAFVCGFWNDNHAVRTATSDIERFARDRDPRPEISRFLNDWYCAPTGKPDCPRSGRARPLVIVAAAGGASRSAYWTVTVLGKLEEAIPGFSDQVVAISGVSGGSLGAAVYRAALEAGDRSNAMTCVPEGESKQSNVTMTRCMQAVIAHDFLAPTIAAFLYPEVVQRFSPVPCAWLPALCAPDRARALEQSWEVAWRGTVGDDRFAQPFGELFATAKKAWPALYLNGTLVETGQRIIVSSVKLDGYNKDTVDLFAAIDADVPFSTAVNMSARFPYIESAGTLRRLEGEQSVAFGHIVDGGYFENFGAVTAREILNAARAQFGTSVIPVVIQISADPSVAAEDAMTERRDQPSADAAPVACPTAELHSTFNESLSPIVTFLATRSAHGRQASLGMEGQFIDAAAPALDQPPDGIYVHFQMRLTDVPDGEPLAEPPLAWAMSKRALADIRALMTRNESVAKINLVKDCLVAGACKQPKRKYCRRD